MKDYVEQCKVMWDKFAYADNLRVSPANGHMGGRTLFSDAWPRAVGACAVFTEAIALIVAGTEDKPL
jgi:hypothetical protein